MCFTLKPMNERDAHSIAQWHYKEPYTFYEFEKDPEDLEGLSNPQIGKISINQCLMSKGHLSVSSRS